jgi:hypothetical protein
VGRANRSGSARNAPKNRMHGCFTKCTGWHDQCTDHDEGSTSPTQPVHWWHEVPTGASDVLRLRCATSVPASCATVDVCPQATGSCTQLTMVKEWVAGRTSSLAPDARRTLADFHLRPLHITSCLTWDVTHTYANTNALCHSQPKAEASSTRRTNARHSHTGERRQKCSQKQTLDYASGCRHRSMSSCGPCCETIRGLVATPGRPRPRDHDNDECGGYEQINAHGYGICLEH